MGIITIISSSARNLLGGTLGQSQVYNGYFTPVSYDALTKGKPTPIIPANVAVESSLYGVLLEAFGR